MKFLNVSSLVKKTIYITKISGIEKNMLLILVIINLRVKYLMQR